MLSDLNEARARERYRYRHQHGKLYKRIQIFGFIISILENNIYW